ncbi:MAG: hypothetical protein N3F09_01170 [Bacteroidia bacterium]|nr:hypothetical protein [Bacteroidia bacterium]
MHKWNKFEQLKHKFSILFLCVAYFTLKAQYLDTLHEVFISKSSLDIRLESRWSFLEGSPIRIEGYRLGVSFRKKIRIGGGISWMKSNFFRSKLYPAPNGDWVETKENLMLYYFCYYIDFVFHKTKRWQLSTPLQFGAGWYWWQGVRRPFFRDSKFDHFLYLYEPGISVQYKVFPFLGAGMDVCYRFGNADSGYLKYRFHSPSYGVKFLFWIHQLFFYLFPNSPITKKYGPVSW